MKNPNLPFDWRAFCADHGIVPKERGSGTSKGNVNISCPWCEDGQNHQHMGLSVSNSAFHCWKNDMHAGYNAPWLIKALLKVSWASAAEIARRYGFKHFRLSERDEVPVTPAASFEMPKGVQHNFPAVAQRYLASRDFSISDAQSLGLLFGGSQNVDTFAWRIVFPIKDLENCLVGATGRAVGDSSLRYLTLPTSECPHVVGTAWLSCRRFLTVTEGPFDAAKLQVAANFSRLPFDSIALRTLTPSEDTLRVVQQLACRYEMTIFILDDKEYSQSQKFARRLATPSIAWRSGSKDPGALTVPQAVTMLHNLWSTLNYGTRTA